MSLASEALLSESGLFRTKPIGSTMGKRAEGIPARWKSAVDKFFTQTSQEPFVYKNPPPQVETLETLTSGISVDDMSSLTAGLENEDVRIEYLASLNNAREYLRSVWPSRSLDLITGPDMVPVGAVELNEAGSIYHVVNDPSTFLQEILSGTVTQNQIDAMAFCYPRLLEMLIAMVQDRIITGVAKDKSWRVPWHQERIVRMLTGQQLDVVVKPVVQPAPQVSTPRIDIDFKGQSTKEQRLNSE